MFYIVEFIEPSCRQWS